jgi:PadR family transcriptional regulator, regulatory protein PadR
VRAPQRAEEIGATVTASTPAGLPRSFLRPCLLLLLAEAPAHGYDLLEQLADLGIEQTDPGGLYRALRAMEEEQLVRSWWEPSDAGPPRRTYTLTAEGRDWLHAGAGSIREVRRILGRYLARYEEAAERTVADGSGRSAR